MTRRQALKSTALASAALATLPNAMAQTNSAASAFPAPGGPFTLPPLPYAYGALEPFIDAQTMQIHHAPCAKSNCYPRVGIVVPKGCYPVAFVLG